MMHDEFDPSMIKKDDVWECKDGKRIKIKRMNDQHLCNTINMLIRNCEKMKVIRANEMLAYIETALAADCCERELNTMMEMEVFHYLDTFVPEFKYLMKEFKRRRLQKDFIHG